MEAYNDPSWTNYIVCYKRKGRVQTIPPRMKLQVAQPETQEYLVGKKFSGRSTDHVALIIDIARVAKNDHTIKQALLDAMKYIKKDTHVTSSWIP
jgi:hypothetical protein